MHPIHCLVCAQVDAPLGAFFLTFYVAPTLTLHPTSSKNADAAFREKHAGGLLSPPFDSERVAELGAFEHHVVNVDGCVEINHCWLRRAVRNRHPTLSSWRRVDGVEVDAKIQHERAVNF